MEYDVSTGADYGCVQTIRPPLPGYSQGSNLPNTQDEFFARRHAEREAVKHSVTGETPPPQVPDQPEDVAGHGVKFDRGKPKMSALPIHWLQDLATEVEGALRAGLPVRLDLVPVEVLVELAVLYGTGAKKYDDRNWEKGFNWSRAYDAAHRHLAALWNGWDVDPESASPHAIAAMWNCVSLAWFRRHRTEFDDRPSFKEGKLEPVDPPHLDLGNLSQG